MPAYHETHDAPHCPTCDCGVESLSRQGGEQFGNSEPLTRASEAGDCLYRVQEYMHTHHDFLVSIQEYEKAAATPITDEAIAAAPAPGGGPINSNNQTRISDEN